MIELSYAEQDNVAFSYITIIDTTGNRSLPRFFGPIGISQLPYESSSTDPSVLHLTNTA